MNTLASCLKAITERALRDRLYAGTCYHQVIRRRCIGEVPPSPLPVSQLGR
ncbi:hypothetical protein [Scytonema sp. PRP1]|uniref:hypothetical protein n=1 Tax=Scytonema sp. PRP1 TaxID=3120513 RepID=UPI002FCF84AE